MDTVLNKSFKRSLGIAKHLNNSDCAKNNNDNKFSNVNKACNDYHLSVSESLLKTKF